MDRIGDDPWRPGSRHEPDVERVIARIKGLVLAREQLRVAGASDAELELKASEIGRLHARLAREVRRTLREHRHDVAREEG